MLAAFLKKGNPKSMMNLVPYAPEKSKNESSHVIFQYLPDAVLKYPFGLNK